MTHPHQEHPLPNEDLRKLVDVPGTSSVPTQTKVFAWGAASIDILMYSKIPIIFFLHFECNLISAMQLYKGVQLCALMESYRSMGINNMTSVQMNAIYKLVIPTKNTFIFLPEGVFRAVLSGKSDMIHNNSYAPEFCWDRSFPTCL